jgi:hypothetical protein
MNKTFSKNSLPSRLLSGAFIIALTAGLSGASSKSDPSTQTVEGEVTDTLCAPHASHDYMMDQMKSMGKDSASCVQKCLQVGAKWALLGSDKKTVYKIDNPDKVEQFAGHQVRITGEVHKSNLKVTDVQQTD